ncbi:hypothetical protein VOLCADRAFT_95363 [Volvox carteri f. nagariensis]|uniref:Pherophorin domain-containing protein n=1 Tax=Volvox carteri f. nagariensis TaxID=3068 RepID=D8U791_VOLCA|nr:uncharacterized protein VOLCADRAFT_95363 [Volvox carteri f. nagariensis]EFJ44382.1 hypothetical protein VOLCADRAFT_95363 [Volvox carteri f. nagariensis]|eukprot:XP_002954489.1 hypothetical protein VOLCADRAFT_95363 [Volvox carteri f. nagariensis]
MWPRGPFMNWGPVLSLGLLPSSDTCVNQRRRNHGQQRHSGSSVAVRSLLVVVMMMCLLEPKAWMQLGGVEAATLTGRQARWQSQNSLGEELLNGGPGRQQQQQQQQRGGPWFARQLMTQFEDAFPCQDLCNKECGQSPWELLGITRTVRIFASNTFCVQLRRRGCEASSCCDLLSSGIDALSISVAATGRCNVSSILRVFVGGRQVRPVVDYPLQYTDGSPSDVGLSIIDMTSLGIDLENLEVCYEVRKGCAEWADFCRAGLPGSNAGCRFSVNEADAAAPLTNTTQPSKPTPYAGPAVAAAPQTPPSTPKPSSATTPKPQPPTPSQP